MELEFSRDYEVSFEKVIQIITDYQSVLKLMPPQFNGIILEQNEDEVLIEETIELSILKTKIKQKSIHKKITPTLFEINTISGPVKGSSINILVQDIKNKTKITVKANFNLGLKYRILSSFIKKKYRIVLEQLIDKITGLALLTDGRDWNECTVNNGETLVLSEKYFSLRFDDWWQGDLKQVFVDETYKKMPFSGKTVVDIGANIGDSSIYFAVNGAEKVIALEPFPRNFSVGKKNIINNNLNEKIVFLLSGCSDKDSIILVNENNVGTSYGLEKVDKGIAIQTRTLAKIVEEFNIDSAVLKLDCEGCEYGVILGTPPNVLQKFESVLIEYHHGYLDLEKKLRECGFNTKVNKNMKPEYANKGYIFANKIQ